MSMPTSVLGVKVLLGMQLRQHNLASPFSYGETTATICFTVDGNIVSAEDKITSSLFPTLTNAAGVKENGSRNPILSVLIATLLCSCSAESKASNRRSSSQPPNFTVAQSRNVPVTATNPITDENPGREIAFGQATTAPSADSAAKDSTSIGYVRFPTVGIKLQQPEGFEKASSFDGFGQPETTSSVMALSIPGPFSKLTAGFTHEQMKARGWTLLSRQDIKIDGLPGILVHFEQPAGGIVFLKWSVVFGDDQKTTIVTATFPKTLAQELSARLKSAVLSTRLDRSPAPAPGADLPFTLEVSPKLKLSPGISKTLVYTTDGIIPTKLPKEPLFIVAPSLGRVAIADKQQFAEQRLYKTAHTKRVSIKSTAAIIIDGLNGYESLAEAEDAKSGTPLILYQVILFDGGSYILIQGLVGAELQDEYLPEFRSMVRSLQRRQP